MSNESGGGFMSAVKGLLASKKVAVTILGLIVNLLVLLASNAGLDADTATTLATNLSIIFLSWLGAQGLADAGKGKVQAVDPNASVWGLLKAMAKQLMGSKKFTTLVAGIVGAGAATLAPTIGVSEEAASGVAMKITVAASGLLGVQGVTDLGKEKAKIEGAAKT